MSEDNWQSIGDIAARIVDTAVSFTEDGITGTDELACPSCGGGNLHHSTITVFSRREDEAEVLQTKVCGVRGTVTVTRDAGADNPSRRRDGIAIGFYCETCRVAPELTIAQHKGSTFINWRVR
jgi:hypothetical protein